MPRSLSMATHFSLLDMISRFDDSFLSDFSYVFCLTAAKAQFLFSRQLDWKALGIPPCTENQVHFLQYSKAIPKILDYPASKMTRMRLAIHCWRTFNETRRLAIC